MKSRPICGARDTREQGKDDDSPIGHYRFVRDGIEVLPGPQSLHAADAAIIRFENGKVSAIQITGREGDRTQDTSSNRCW